MKQAQLRPEYFYFTNQDEAQRFAESKNKRSKVNHWLAVLNCDETEPYTVYNIRVQHICNVCQLSANEEPFCPHADESIETSVKVGLIMHNLNVLTCPEFNMQREIKCADKK